MSSSSATKRDVCPGIIDENHILPGQSGGDQFGQAGRGLSDGEAHGALVVGTSNERRAPSREQRPRHGPSGAGEAVVIGPQLRAAVLAGAGDMQGVRQFQAMVRP
jgi:hypothetical protein